MNLPPLILASASPRRAELLRQLKLDFRIVPSDAKEIFDEQLSPSELCQLNAHRKARAVAKKNPDSLVLGADTLVFLDGEIMGKPAEHRRCGTDVDTAARPDTSGRHRHQPDSFARARERMFAVSTDVMFHPLDAGQIRDYLAKMNPLDKAGAYAIQEHGDMIIAEISGSCSNVVGLPLERLRAELSAWTA